jgi:hypothetical protein
VNNNYSVTTLDFSRFSSQLGSLTNAGFRIGKAGASLRPILNQNILPFHQDSKSAWVTLKKIME